MKPHPVLLPLSLALALASAGAPAMAETAPAADHERSSQAHDHGHAPGQTPAAAHDPPHAHEHHHHGHVLLPPVPDNHQPWATDEPLRQGMTRVRKAVATVPAEAGARIDPATATALADEVDAAINYMFANCSLPPEPDAALHGVLAQLMVSSGELRSEAADAGPQVAKMRAALDRYALLFDDPAARAAGYGGDTGAHQH